LTWDIEDEDIEDGPEEEPLDGLVEALFDEIEHLRLQVRFLNSIAMLRPADATLAL
jgi:hypothetical protein